MKGPEPRRTPALPSLDHPQHQKHDNYDYHRHHKPDYSLLHRLSSFPVRFVVLFLPLKNHYEFDWSPDSPGPMWPELPGAGESIAGYYA